MTGPHAGRALPLVAALVALVAGQSHAADRDVAAPTAAGPRGGVSTGTPLYLADRGTGIATSMLGIYVRKHEWLLYAFYEYTKTIGFEYNPEELGFTGGEDHLGTLTENEELVFVSYGLSDRVEVEFEAALHATASFEKAPDDLSDVPGTLEESGLGDVEGQVRWRWTTETARCPELFSYLDVGFPLQRSDVLLGTHDWEYSIGFAAIKGFRWGTLTGRVSALWDQADGQLEAGEYAVEYLKRLSPCWRFVGAIEGDTDEVQVIVEGQARLSEHVLLKLNSGFGVTTKAPDYAPEIGLLFSF
jgi:hypothetical protein